MTRHPHAWLVALSTCIALVDCGGSTPTPVASAPVASAPGVTSATCRQATGGRGGSATVVAAALAFRDTLPPASRASLERPLARAGMLGCSNLPVGLVPRAGLRLGDLDATRYAVGARAVDAPHRRAPHCVQLGIQREGSGRDAARHETNSTIASAMPAPHIETQTAWAALDLHRTCRTSQVYCPCSPPGHGFPCARATRTRARCGDAKWVHAARTAPTTLLQPGSI